MSRVAAIGVLVLAGSALGQVACPSFTVPGAAVRPIAVGQTGVLEAHVQSGARFVTNDGTMDIDLMLSEAPNTSANFLNYVRSGRYNGVMFHRSVRLAPSTQIGIIQAGGFFAPTAAVNQAPSQQNPLTPAQRPQPVAADPPIAIENAVGNVRGTIAMARTSIPTSATNQFFINTVDNNADVPGQRFSLDASPFDPQERPGYAVFGRVTPETMGAVDVIRDRTYYGLSSLFGDGNFANTPLRVPPAQAGYPLLPSHYVVISAASVRTTPVASYAGSAGWTYQWKRNGVDLVDGGRITGATTGTLSIASMTAADFGEYRCVVLGMACTGGSGSSNLVTLFCPSDLGVSGGSTGSDGVLDNNDFISFITLFFAADAKADLGRAGGESGSDGAFNNNDFIAFISHFFAGC